ncbi:DUF4012 domain-containing protein [Agreia sp.]|uniref:DUF4012 domain-containing protein n=1 Tax=Agreia sp. TaxID=1872416 RepID=UPI0035BC1607
MTQEALRPRRAGSGAKAKRPRYLRWVIGVFVLLVLASLLWVGVRGYLAKGELEDALKLAGQAREQIAEGDSQGAYSSAQSLAKHSRAAADLTSDPVWCAYELVPVLGANLSVTRVLASSVDDLSEGVLIPLADLTRSISLDDLKPVDGGIVLQPFVDSQPVIGQANSQVHETLAQIRGVDASGLFEPIERAKNDLEGAVSDVAAGVDAVDKAATLIPSMLGQDSPRNYLVLFQNNAELRSSGGIPGAMALISTSGGRISLAQQASSRDFEKFDSPVIELPIETRSLYGNHTAEYIQDVTFTPQFELTGQIAREMWKRQFGVEVDGVISLDPVALSYLLDATGPVELSNGQKLSSDNAVRLLLQDVYSMFEDPADQDAFFANAAASVFNKVASGDLNPTKLVKALGSAAEERRLLVWSSHDDDDALLEGTSLSGALPLSSSTTEAFGLYLNDATAAKMDNYLDVKISKAQKVCRSDGLPNYSIVATVTNTAPGDAGATLPEYVTGGGASGVPPGSIRTNVTVYGPPGSFNLGVLRDKSEVGYHPTSDSGYTLSNLQVELAPGESTVLEFQFLGGDAQPKKMVVEHTPLVYSLGTSNIDLGCESALQ